MTLATQQRDFLAEIAADDDLPSSSVGMAIYRNAYRGRLSDALTTGFERTRRWVGEDAFEQAAAHYILSHPPRQWTLDRFGEDFPALLAALFADDPEVADLAWLEWQLQQAFAAPDAPVLTTQDLADANLGEDDWARLGFAMAPGFSARAVTSDIAGLWPQLSDDLTTATHLPLPVTCWLIVWRKDFAPHYRTLEAAEWESLSALASGASFGEVVAKAGEDRLPQFGAWFAAWLNDGLLSAMEISAA